MVRVVCDAKERLDDLGNAPGGPQFGGKAVFARPGLEGAFENRHILGFKARRPAGFGRLLERWFAAAGPSLVPAAGRLAGDPELARHFGGSQSFVEQGGGLQPPPLQCVKIAFLSFWKSHARADSLPSNRFTLLCRIQ